jgi:type I restriction enzyme M protein
MRTQRAWSQVTLCRHEGPPHTLPMPHPNKRAVLGILTVKRLGGLCDTFELERPGSARKDDLIELLAASKRASFEALLAELRRDELKEICRAHGLDDGGKEKEPIIARILGRASAPVPEDPPELPARPSDAAEGAPPESAKKPRAKKGAPDTSANLGFEAKLWQAADKLRNNMDAAEYKHVVLGLIFLKYISDTFDEHHDKLVAGKGEYAGADPEDKDEYLAANVFWVPKEARWAYLQANAKLPRIGKDVDDAMVAIERDNPRLKGALNKNYGRADLDKHRLGELIDLIGSIQLADVASRSKDLLGRVFEYFLTQFASAEGKNGGQFYTPSCVVRLLVEMLAPYKGRIYDPACGSGGMFVQSEKFVESHGGKLGDISVYGQESNPTTRRLAVMNLALRGIEADFGPEHADTFRRVLHPDLRADYVLANPPFNDSDWFRKDDDVRWQYGVPPKGNANFAWVQHFIHHLAPSGMAGFVLANGSMSSNQSGEGEIRRALIEADLIDCMVAMPGQLFYSTQIPVCLWFIAKKKNDGKRRDRRKQTLFIDARKLGTLIDRVHRELTDADLQKIVATYHAWRGEKGAGTYEDLAGFCKSATTAEIAAHGHVLTPGRYVGAEEVEDDGDPFEDSHPSPSKKPSRRCLGRWTTRSS